MNNQPAYEQLIIEGIKGLPQDVLAEIAHFVFFMRKRITHPQSFEAELQTVLLEEDLTHLWEAELVHLEEEFTNYEQDYPLE